MGDIPECHVLNAEAIDYLRLPLKVFTIFRLFMLEDTGIYMPLLPRFNFKTAALICQFCLTPGWIPHGYPVQIQLVV